MQTRLDDWDRRFLAMAKLIASWSKDPSTQVGCVITDPCYRIVAAGFNGFPRGVKDTEARLNNREFKYKFTQHAERNAISFAVRDLTGCTAYTYPLPPCAQCAGALIQAGVTRVVSLPLSKNHERWQADYLIALTMYEEAGIISDFENIEFPKLV